MRIILFLSEFMKTVEYIYCYKNAIVNCENEDKYRKTEIESKV